MNRLFRFFTDLRRQSLDNLDAFSRQLRDSFGRFQTRWNDFGLRVRTYFENNPDQLDASTGFIISLVLFIFLVLDVAYIAEWSFDHGRSSQFIDEGLRANPFFRGVIGDLIRPIASLILVPTNGRFLMTPLAAIIIVWIASASYIRGMFNVPTFGMAFTHVISALFFIGVSSMRVSRSARLPANQINKLDIIGGPGFLEVEQDSAVLVRGPYGNLRQGSGRALYMRNFERIVMIISTEDQHERQEEKVITTRDGIKVNLRNMDWRYRVLPPEGENQGQRSLSNSYPMAPNAMLNMANNMSADAAGRMDWNIAVRNMVTGAVEDYVYAHTVDQVTSPSFAGGDPRSEMRDAAFTSNIANNLRNIGARLLWIDPGVPDIPEPDVDNSRINLWASDFMGDSEAQAAYAQARVAIYREQGRAEGQAELIMGITQALDQIQTGVDKEGNLRLIMLARTAQLLDAMSSKEPPKEQS